MSLSISQKNELIILDEICRICQKYNLKYILSSGTLLGAIRHNGFIPWDDDIDIEMPLDDYKKFLQICKTELSDNFFLQTFETDPNFFNTFAKIRMNNTTFISWDGAHHHIHQGFWVDIFPIISASRNEIIKSMKLKIIKFGEYLQMKDYCVGRYDDFCNEVGKRKTDLIIRLGSMPLKFRVFLHKLIFKFSLRNPKKGKPASIFWTTFGKTRPVDYWINVTDHAFEDKTYKIPICYDKYLSNIYGDYMQLPPENNRKTHGALFISETENYTAYIDMV